MSPKSAPPSAASDPAPSAPSKRPSSSPATPPSAPSPSTEETTAAAPSASPSEGPEESDGQVEASNDADEEGKGGAGAAAEAPAPSHAGRVPIRTAHWELHPVVPPSVFVAKRVPGPVTSEASPTTKASSAPTGPMAAALPASETSPPPSGPAPGTDGPTALALPASTILPPRPSSSLPPIPDKAVADAREILRRVQGNIGQAVIGMEGVVRALLIALVGQGHILLEGVPGLAKTYLVRAFARSLALSFRRIQFTPDMLPADILGTVVLDPRTQMFEFRPGPIFAHVVLADEINRAPPKVQSALLEAMQERQVTIEGVSYPLPSPFVVIATENPVELEGTYPLPEAELDRFLFRILLGYPSAENELRLLKQRTVTNDPAISDGVLGGPALLALRDQAQSIHVNEDILRYIAALLRETRSDPRVLSGVSPRAGVQLLMAVKAAALFSGRPFVIPDDVKDLAFDVLNHRLVLRPEVLALQSSSGGGTQDGGRTLQEVVFSLINKVAVPW